VKAPRDLVPFRLRSATPGRERWDVWPLKRAPLLAEGLELELSECGGVLQARANALTGRVLVVFDEDVLNDIGSLLAELLAKLGVAVAETPAGDARPATRRGWAPASALFDDNDLVSLVRSVEPSKRLRQKAAVWTVANTLSSLVPPLSLGAIMASAVLGGIPFLTSLGLAPARQLALLGLAFLGGNALNTATEFQSKKAWQEYATDVEHALRTQTFRHVLALDMAYLEDQSTSQTLSIIHDDSVRIRTFLASVPDNTIDRLATFGAGGALLISISPISFFLSLAPLPAVWILYRRFHERVAEGYQKIGESEMGTRKRLSNSLTGLTTIRSFSTEESEQEQLKEASEQIKEDVNAAFADALKYADWTKFTMVAGMGLPIVYAGGLLIQGSISSTVFMLQSFMMPKMIGTMGGLDGLYDQYRGAYAASTRMKQLLSVQPEINSGEEPIAAGNVDGAVSFEHISFAYPSSDGPVFDDFDLRVPARRSVGIVGATGSGKSTLLKLLLRFYDVDSGRVVLDGRNIRDLHLSDLRRSIGLVSQDVFLFHGTVYDNILYGRPEASPEEVREAARVTESLDFIEALPDGFSTVVGERGQKLSGGERQRISIARVVLKNPPILVFDEATSAVDSETEAGILETISHLAVDRTLIIIAHRLSTVRRVDQIVVLERGRLVESGSHAELLERDGAYANLWRLQAGDEAIETELGSTS